MESFVQATCVVPPVECDRRATVLKMVRAAPGIAVAIAVFFSANAALAASKGKDRPSAPSRSASGGSTAAHGNAAEERLRTIMKICRCDEYDRAKGVY